MSGRPAALPLSLRLYALATGALSPLVPGLLKRRAARGKEDPARIGERLGQAGLARPDGPLVWLHGASVGEALSLLPLIQALADERPDLGLLVTSGTTTSAALMAQRLPPGVLHQYAPVDTPDVAAAFLDHWRPALAVFVESEIWPNLLLGAKARGVRLALLSAKVSQGSFRGWLNAPAAARRLFGGFDLILAQDARAAERLTVLGGRPAGVADLKFGAAPLPVNETGLALRRTQLAGRRVVLAASTHPGEDELIVACWRKAVQGSTPALLAIAPRHPERGRAIVDAVRAAGLGPRRQSAGEVPDGEVFIIDVLGELGLWYRLADLAVIGGSFLTGVGGHNPLEPARLGAPFVSGSHVENWATAYRDLVAADGTRMINSETALTAVIGEALAGQAALPLMAERARAQVDLKDVAARDALREVLALAPPRPAP